MGTSLQREIDGSMDSYWIDQSKKVNYTISSAPIEQDDTSKLVETLLNEFVHSSDEEREEFKQILQDWLSEMDDKSLDLERVEELRDLIYEMF